ncbi:DUF523 and DUF1722 domain-containing protein [Haloplasma contractile]|uniref:Purine-nucleoside phosphorylase protein n=1 Tax=Haloplasma contractile SSD-17B TaxID=1033810 RepID=F7PWK1_9MOLU|nr:DUF523 and DUF1722 domain-containing protein [Haloplasma contractile]ERJ12632.1 purine-nucleoside phosphorylase protein [Haloplasma contractile SSD-17B]
MLNRKPRLIVSKCLGVDHCRYSNTICKSKIVDLFKKHMELIPVCPEQEIGLPTPRESLRIVNREDNKLIQPKTGEDYTKEMLDFSEAYFKKNNTIDGFILKGRSPSCGIKDVKVYDEDGNIDRGKTSGLFAGKCMEQYKGLPLEDEGRLTNYKIRDLFLTKLYTVSEFNDIKRENNLEWLKSFHQEHELLFKLYNKTAYKKMNTLLFNNVPQIFSLYEEQLQRVFQKRFRKDSFKKSVQRLFKEMTPELSSKEVSFINGVIQDFDNELVSEQVIEYILKNNLLRFEMSHYYTQRLFNKYPKPLYTPTDSGK